MFRVRFGDVNTCETRSVKDLGAERVEPERNGQVIVRVPWSSDVVERFRSLRVERFRSLRNIERGELAAGAIDPSVGVG